MARFFAPPEAWDEGRVRLDPQEARHAGEVLRKGIGESLTVFDGQGRVALAVLTRVGKSGAEVALEETWSSPRLPCALTLVQAIPKGKTMEWILEKSVELGVARVVPVITERTVVQLEAREAAQKREKWERVLIEACKQCGQDWVPQLEEPRPFSRVLEEEAGPWELAIVGSLHAGAVGFGEALEAVPKARTAGVWIGPEGDFSRVEMENLIGWGARPVSLGPLVLRAETAALYALSVLAHTYAR
jgi:16S rRNA (uracil1498-N3)-methyltransferase